MEKNQYPIYVSSAIKLLLIIMIGFVLVITREIMVPLAISILTTFLLYPLSKKLEDFYIPRWLAIVMSLILTFIVIAVVVYFFWNQVISFANDLPLLKDKAVEKGDHVLMSIESRTGIPQEKMMDLLKRSATKSIESGPTVLVNVFSATGVFLLNLTLIPVYVFFFTYFREKFKNFIVIIFEHKESHEKVLNVIRKISVLSQSYMKGLVLNTLIMAILKSTGFLILGLDHAILFGVLAAVLSIIPYIGSFIGAILPFFVAIITKDSFGYALGVLAVAVVVQFLDTNLIIPLVMGSSVSINPVTALIALVGFGVAWGIMGLILSIPLIGILKIIFDSIDELKPYGYLMGEEEDFGKKDKFQDKVLSRFKKNVAKK